MGKAEHDFNDYLRAKANAVTDVGIKNTLIAVAEAFEDMTSQKFLANETNVVADDNPPAA